jgi:adenosylcobyric acid synthase
MTCVPPVLVCGTGPNSSKSNVCLAILRLLQRGGIPVVPFKAITVLEPERWQFAASGCPIPHHVAAARAVWRPEMAPVLVELAEATGPALGLLRIHGESFGHVRLSTPDTLDGADLTPTARRAVLGAVTDSLARLREENTTIVAEGAGSPIDADDDMANLLVAKCLPDARILLSAYCWNGGCAAAIIGTISLLPAELREAMVGFILNRPMSWAAAKRWIATIQERIGLPLVGSIGDMSGFASADLLQTTDALADPWADALAETADLSWLCAYDKAAR